VVKFTRLTGEKIESMGIVPISCPGFLFHSAGKNPRQKRLEFSPVDFHGENGSKDDGEQRLQNHAAGAGVKIGPGLFWSQQEKSRKHQPQRRLVLQD